MSGKTIEAYTGCILLIITVPLTMLLDGWVLSHLWGWFIVPVGVRPITLLEAIGISLTVGLITQQYIKNRDEDKSPLEATFTYMFAAAFRPVLVLILGYIVFSLM